MQETLLSQHSFHFVPKSGQPLSCSELQVAAKNWKACRSAQSDLVDCVCDGGDAQGWLRRPAIFSDDKLGPPPAELSWRKICARRELLRRNAGPPAEMKKADGPCRAIEIVVVMRLTTSSARPESNFQNHDRSRRIFGIGDQKPVIVRNLNQLLAGRHVTGRA